ncbi:MAG TPA: hypothetical protein VGO93_00245 [Candidatus Xenobia bacterium]
MIGSHSRRWPEVVALLQFLAELDAFICKVGASLDNGPTSGLHIDIPTPLVPTVREYLIKTQSTVWGTLCNRFLDAFQTHLKASPATVVDWAREVQSRLEKDGKVVLPAREILYRALTSQGEDKAAEDLAIAVVSWPELEQYPQDVELWRKRMKNPPAPSGAKVIQTEDLFVQAAWKAGKDSSRVAFMLASAEPDGAITGQAVQAGNCENWPLPWRNPGSPANSSLEPFLEQAASQVREDQHEPALALLDEAVAAFDRLGEPTDADRLAWCSVIMRQAMSQQELARSEDAWRTASRIMGPEGQQVPKPLAGMITWTHTSILVAMHTRRCDELTGLLGFLHMLYIGLGSTRALDAKMRVLKTFVGLLKGSYDHFSKTLEPAAVAQWARELPRRLEYQGHILLPARKILFSALMQEGSYEEACQVARDVLAAEDDGLGERSDWKAALDEATSKCRPAGFLSKVKGLFNR